MWQIRCIPIGGVMSSAAVAVVLGAAELVWLDQEEKHRQLGFHFGERLACYPVPISLVSGADTAVHTWVDVELRVIGQHVAVNVKNPNRSWVHNRGPQQKSTFLPWTGVLKGGMGSIRGVVLGHFARTKMLGLPEQFGVARLLEDIVELVYMGYPLSVIRGLVHSLPCSRVTQISRKTVRTWLSFGKERMVLDDKKDQRQKPRHGAAGIAEVVLVVPEILGGTAGGARQGKVVRLPLHPPAKLGGNLGESTRRLKKRRNCWRSMIRNTCSGKRRPRRKRGRWSCKSKRRCSPRL